MTSTRTTPSAAAGPPSQLPVPRPAGPLARSRIWLGRQRYLARRWRCHRANERALLAADPVLPVRIHAPLAGLGAHFTMATVILHACRTRGVTPWFRFTSPHYGESGGSFDWLSRLYDQPRVSVRPAVRPEMIVTCWDDLSPSFRTAAKLDRHALAAILHEHFVVAPELAERCARLADAHVGRGRTLGVHFRGGDKYTEARPVSHDEMAAAIADTLRADPGIDRIFVATDSAPFLAALGPELHGRRVHTVPEVQRTHDRTGVHFQSGGDRPLRAAQALVDALLLGRCARLVKTESSLSQWTLLLHPDLPVTQLNGRYRAPLWAPWFPLREDFTAATVA